MGIVTGYLSQLVSSGIKLLNNGTAVSSSNTAGFTEINSELRIDFLSWASQKITVTLNGACLFNVTGADDGYAHFGIAIDGAAVSDNATGMVGAFGVDNYGDEAWNATYLLCMRIL